MINFLEKVVWKGRFSSIKDTLLRESFQKFNFSMIISNKLIKILKTVKWKYRKRWIKLLKKRFTKENSQRIEK